jgi:adenylate cyclase
MLPGTLVILNAVNTILTREFITVTPDWCVSLLALVLPFMLGGLYLFRKPALSILYASLIVGVLLAASPALFYIRACFLPVTVPLLACIVSALVLATHAHVREHTRATRMAALLARVASPALVQEIERQGTRPHAPKTRREELSVLFVDVAAYTPFTDHAEPEDLSGFLVAFYEATMEELPRHQGTLHQFLGDGILAYFGAPAPLLDKERLAVEAAMALQNRFAQICNARRGRGEKLLQIRCGIATGYVSIGFFGSERHAAYSVVGSAVNLAARLQSLGEPGQIILDERTAARLRNVVKLESLGHLKLKGFDQPASVYRVATVKQI